jgi:hypothetical protein
MKLMAYDVILEVIKKYPFINFLSELLNVIKTISYEFFEAENKMINK